MPFSIGCSDNMKFDVQGVKLSEAEISAVHGAAMDVMHLFQDATRKDDKRTFENAARVLKRIEAHTLGKLAADQSARTPSEDRQHRHAIGCHAADRGESSDGFRMTIEEILCITGGLRNMLTRNPHDVPAIGAQSKLLRALGFDTREIMYMIP